MDGQDQIENEGDNYVVHGAQIKCSCGLRPSHVVVPVSHGAFIHNIAQLTVEDYKPNVNIQHFGGCKSPENPAVQEAAKATIEAVNNEPKGFVEKVIGFFCKPKEGKGADDSFVSECAAACTPIISKPWDNGKEIVELDGKNPLLKKSTLTCSHGGAITVETTGQPV